VLFYFKWLKVLLRVYSSEVRVILLYVGEKEIIILITVNSERHLTVLYLMS